MKDFIHVLVAGVIGALAAYFNVLLVPLAVLVAVMLIDWITGLAGASATGKLNSRVGVIGIVKKVCYLALVAVGLAGESIPFWIILVAEAVFLIVCLIVLIRQDIARATVRKIEKDAAAATVDMKRLRSKAQALCSTIEDPVNAKALQELADELQFSDPVSNSATSSYENRINTLLESIGHHQDAGERGELIRRAIALTKERAIVAKTNK